MHQSLYKSGWGGRWVAYNFSGMSPREFSTIFPPLVLTCNAATGTIALNNCTSLHIELSILD